MDMSDRAQRNLKLVVAYDGTAYAGWQMQPNAPTIQGILTDVASTILDHPVQVNGASRTDAGVHANYQVAGLKTGTQRTVDQIMKGLNALLPPDIRVMEVADVPSSFHPRFSAVEKIYRYRLFTGRALPPMEHRFVHHVFGSLDLDAMVQASVIFEGEHDFASFRDAQCSARTTVRSISQSRLNVLNDGFVEYTIVGNRFLHHMVRIIVGTLIWVGKRKLSIEDIHVIFKEKDRRCAGPTAPAHGLFLEHITFKKEDACPGNSGA